MKKTIYVQIIRGDPRVIEKENASIAENYEKKPRLCPQIAYRLREVKQYSVLRISKTKKTECQGSNLKNLA